MNRPTLSVCIVTQDMAHFLHYVLDSVADIATEIVVVDSFSTDGTVDLCTRYPQARVLQRPFGGHFADQKNFALSQAKSDWVLVMDSDEVLGDHCREKIPELITKEKYSYYKFRRYWVLGGPPWEYVHSDMHYPDYQLRLFRNTPFFQYRSDDVVHTHFPREGRGPGRKMKSCHIFHFDFALKDRRARRAKYQRYVALDPASRDTSRMYLYEDVKFARKRCREPLSAGVDLAAVRRAKAPPVRVRREERPEAGGTLADDPR